jgi:Amino acid permease
VLLDYLLLPTLAYVVSAAAMRAIVPSIPQAAWVLLFIASNTTVNLLGIETTARASKIFLAMQLVVIALFILLGVAAIASGVNGAHWSLEPFWTPRAFHVSFVFNALSVAVLSFLGFDAISTLAEEATGGGKAVGQATMISLCLAAILFIAQTWLRRSWSPAGPSLSATRRSTTPSTRSPPSRVGQRSSSSLRSRSPCQRVSPMRWWRRRPPRGCCLRWRAMVNAPPGSVVSQPPLKRSDHLLSRAVKSCTPYNHE